MTEVVVGDRFLIDSNVLIDVIVNDPTWGEWSSQTLSLCARSGACAINPVIYAEVSNGFDEMTHLDRALLVSVLEREAIPYNAAFLAAKAHHAYRRRGGTRAATLPDFFIGAHAIVEGMTLVTRDPRRYLQAFPGIRLVRPE